LQINVWNLGKFSGKPGVFSPSVFEVAWPCIGLQPTEFPRYDLEVAQLFFFLRSRLKLRRSEVASFHHFGLDVLENGGKYQEVF